ncbi:MAG: hypothetical protein KUF80_13925, partial [Candidatus Thiodiazotropha sp. (ex Codakia orbicularis)]|nr:hypothetical protein [Candidatus Thiodiazotropha taylori]MBV2095983.1 hypothetical protein [Candidatus Thiodiazotropha sp. (ex Codakia orbicularis)]
MVISLSVPIGFGRNDGYGLGHRDKKSLPKQALKTEAGSPYLLAISSSFLAGITWPSRAASLALRPK